MATSLVSRSFPKALSLASFLSRSFSVSASASAAHPRCSASSLSLIHRLRPLAGALSLAGRAYLPLSVRCLSTNATSSSLKDPNPNWSNRPPKETILLDGCDFEHWLVVMEPPEGEPTRDEIIDSYIKTLAMVVGSEQDARRKIYSVSTRCYFAFGALVPEEASHKIKELPNVRWVLPDSYLDVKNKDYGGEPFINGEAVPYDPKYHEEWIRNNARANERNRRNDRPRNFDKSRNFERRRENMQNRDFQRGPPGPPAGPPGGNMGPPAPQGNFGGPPPPQGNFGGPPPQGNFGGPPPQGNFGGPPPQGNMGGMPPQNSGGYAPNNYGPPPPNNNWGPPQPPNNSYGGGVPPPPGNMVGGPPAGNHGGMQQNNAGWSGQGSYVPGRDGGNYSG